MKSLFFVSCPLGFEKKLVQEISRFWFLLIDKDGLPTRSELPEFEIYKGGVEFSTELHLGLQVNFFTKMGLRVLLRIGKFKARYYDQFEKEIKKIKWHNYFNLEQFPELSVQIDASKSRLNNSGNLKEAFSHALDSKIKLKDESLNQVMIRIEDDFVEVSLNTSGEHLHFRGYRKEQGEAPLRENLAALVVDYIDTPTYQQITVIDPFVGAGTLLFEAALKDYPVLQRDYDFLKSKYVPSLFKSDSWKKNFKHLLNRKLNLFGVEQDVHTFEKLRNNIKTFQNLFFDLSINIQNADSQTALLNDLKLSAQPLWIVANPPYGERLGVDKSKVLSILSRFAAELQPQGMIILHPTDWPLNFEGYRFSQKIPFSNQGLRLSLSVIVKSAQ